MKKLPYEIPEFELALAEEDINTMLVKSGEDVEDNDEIIFPGIDW